MVSQRLQSIVALVVLDEKPRDVELGTWDCAQENLLAVKR